MCTQPSTSRSRDSSATRSASLTWFHALSDAESRVRLRGRRSTRAEDGCLDAPVRGRWRARLGTSTSVERQVSVPRQSPSDDWFIFIPALIVPHRHSALFDPR